ncbi:MAG: hypothetical protein FWE47_01060 [Oscillospiraceae bacterium]|nr:hypothetical protein [Oscillospiraceae bacterium]
MKKHMKQALKETFKYVAWFAGILVGVILLLTLVSAIPQSAIKNNVEKSAIYMQEIGDRPEIRDNEKWVLDIVTDVNMINIAYYLNSYDAFRAGLWGKYYNNPAPCFAYALHEAITEGYAPNKIYPRYWHGYLVFLKPALMIFSYGGLRIMMHILFYALFATILYLLYKRINWKASLAFFVTMTASTFWLLPLNMQYVNVYFILFFSLTWLLWKQREVTPLPFMIIGMLTSFFDLLTAPGITFVIFATVAVALQKEQSIWKQLLNFLMWGTAWSVGYLAFWACKWIIADHVFNNGTFQDAKGVIKYRTNMAHNQKPIIQVLKVNAGFIFYKWWTPIYAAVAIFMAAMWNRVKGIGVWPFAVLLTLVPPAWIIITKSHAQIHDIFTYRTLAAGFMPFLLPFFYEKTSEDVISGVTDH